MALIAEEQRAAARRLDVDPVLLLAPWGVAWLVGYGLLFLRYGPDDEAIVAGVHHRDPLHVRGTARGRAAFEQYSDDLRTLLGARQRGG